MSDLRNFIDGEHCGARGGQTIANLDPARGVVLGEIPRSGAEDVEAAVKAAKAAFGGSWSRTSVEERARLCEAIAARIEARLDEFARLESQDTGKPVSLARQIDIPRAIANFRFFAGAVRHSAQHFHPMADAFNYTLRRPVGVVALITPWNLPLYLLTWKVAPALAMGNTIVAKPSELTPSTATALAGIFAELGVPDGVFNLVHGYGPEVGQALIEHPDVKAISFTGGTVTGQQVARTAAPLFKKLSLELGGKNPTIVFADCDFEKTVDGTVRAAFANQGQVCLCGSRLFVQAPLYDRFVEAYVARVKAMKVGDPSLAQTQVGSLVSQAHRDKVEGYVALAQEEGGTILCGGKRPALSGPLEQGAFLEPTVIADLPFSCRTAQEEIFGPVVTLHRFEDEAEVVAMANSVRYGLAASLWTRDLGRAHRVSAALETGMVWVNCWLHRDLRVPFGGLKDSGVGREGGAYSLSFFSEDRNICIHLGDGWASEGWRQSADPSGGTQEASGGAEPQGEASAAAATTAEATTVRASGEASMAKEQASGERASGGLQTEAIMVEARTAPKPVGAYPHARRVGELLYLSGIGPRQPQTDAIPGGPVRDAQGAPLDYDAAAQTEAVIQNVKTILEASGSSLDKVIDVQVFLIDMDRDFRSFNEVYKEHFADVGATRTTVAVSALPTPIAVEFKVIAAA